MMIHGINLRCLLQFSSYDSHSQFGDVLIPYLNCWHEFKSNGFGSMHGSRADLSQLRLWWKASSDLYSTVDVTEEIQRGDNYKKP